MFRVLSCAILSRCYFSSYMNSTVRAAVVVVGADAALLQQSQLVIIYFG
jgi:hypothetical protein